VYLSSLIRDLSVRDLLDGLLDDDPLGDLGDLGGLDDLLDIFKRETDNPDKPDDPAPRRVASPFIVMRL
jgi:hypothetical protein